jgi:hypothetical protein
MHALVVYESMFGDTEQVAHAIAEGVGTRAVVRVVAIGDAPTPVPDTVDLVVVGGPTHAFGMSRRNRSPSRPRQPPACVDAEVGEATMRIATPRWAPKPTDATAWMAPRSPMRPTPTSP